MKFYTVICTLIVTDEVASFTPLLDTAVADPRGTLDTHTPSQSIFFHSHFILIFAKQVGAPSGINTERQAESQASSIKASLKRSIKQLM